MNAIRPRARPTVLDRRPFLWLSFDPPAMRPRRSADRRRRARARRVPGIGSLAVPAETAASNDRSRCRGPAALTSNTRSVSCSHKEAQVTKHDADRKARILDFIAATL